jgi:cytochrome c
MKKVLLSLVIASSALLADGAALYGKCATCHGSNGEKPALGKGAIITCWAADKTAAALKGYKDGSYGGATKGVMKAQVDSLSDADIAAISAYIATLK